MHVCVRGGGGPATTLTAWSGFLCFVAGSCAPLLELLQACQGHDQLDAQQQLLYVLVDAGVDALDTLSGNAGVLQLLNSWLLVGREREGLRGFLALQYVVATARD